MSEDLKIVRDQRKDLYSKWKPIFCTALGEEVHFNSRGFNHLLYKIDNVPRNNVEAMYKLGLLPLVRPVIYSAKEIEKYEKRISPIGGTKQRVYKEIEYWSLVSVVGRQCTKVRVVLRKVGTGALHFWSVMKLS